MQRLSDVFTQLLNLLSGVAFAAALLINAANVAGRYLFHSPIFWAEEVTTLLIIWSVCLMSYRLTLQGENLSAEILKPILPRAALRWVAFVLAAAGAILCGYFAYNAYLVVELVARFSQVTNVAEIPKQYVNGSIFAAFVLACLGGIVRSLSLLVSDQLLTASEPVEVQDALAGTK
ncbi:TRAP transporter small permease [Celeribacter sp. HF31]|uniref:TRAP transporter small permease n=1 Tax=Celeribacter sp. HF31 TaxID=2721558 RepID=UPI0020CA47C3|nr:TRAP transporter small permease [Celeribacter sp. HF31]